MDQCLDGGLNFLDSAARSAPTDESDRSQDIVPGRAAEYQVGLAAAGGLAQLRGEQRPLGNANAMPRQPSSLGSADWLKQTISFLITISRVIIYYLYY